MAVNKFRIHFLYLSEKRLSLKACIFGSKQMAFVYLAFFDNGTAFPYLPDLLGMQEVRHNQMEDLKQGLPQYTALGVGRDDGKEAGEYCPIFFNSHRFTLVEYGNFSLSEQPETIGIKGC